MFFDFAAENPRVSTDLCQPAVSRVQIFVLRRNHMKGIKVIRFAVAAAVVILMMAAPVYAMEASLTGPMRS